jgi:hypothetical protein
MTEASRAVQRSCLSSRGRVLREANRRGKWAAITSRIGRDVTETRALAAESAAGRDVYQHCAVPERWRTIFVRGFVKAAAYAMHTTHTVSARSV